MDDTVVEAKPAVALLGALRKAGVPAEMHTFQGGGHGFGLGKTNGTRTWPFLLEAWPADNVFAAR
jgi:dipeptidyl aminopeptidase/acylaminoacyl peptidase